MKNKNICNIAVLLISLIILCLIGLYLLNNNKNIDDLNVNSIAVTNKIIILDAGHGLPDQGASGFFSTTEQKINLDIVFKLQNLLEQSGVKVILTRSDENGIYSKESKSIYDKKISDVQNRVKIVNESNADLLVSIHLNKYPQSSIYRGWQTFYQKGNSESMKIAEFVQNNLNKNIEYNNSRSCHSISDVYLMDNITINGIIVECGFLSNEEETLLLKNEEYQNKIAWGIYLGINEYFESKEF